MTITTANPTQSIITPEGLTAHVPTPKRTVFNQTTDAVSWVRWTWNPITGCRHGCDFCYARAIAAQTKMQPYYPLGFEPMLEPITFSDLSWCDLMVIGAQSATRQSDGDVPVYVKENLIKALPAGVPLLQMQPRTRATA